MSTRRPVRLAVAAALAAVVTACGSGDRIYVDTAGSATFEGRDYLAIDTERMILGSAPLADAGMVSSTNLQVLDNHAYAIGGINPQQAFALRLADGTPIVLIREDGIGSGATLGSFLPELCQYSTESVTDGCPPNAS